MAATLPDSVQDAIMHVKTEKEAKEIVLPDTRYDNILNAPHIVETAEAHPGAPFHILVTDEEELDISEIRRIAGGIL